MKKTIIVMPVANEEATMGQILDEILNLPYNNLYIYPVIDSYSRDRTEEIIREKEKRTIRSSVFFTKSRMEWLVVIWKALKEHWQMARS